MNSKTNKETTLEAWFVALIGRLEQQGKFATSRNYRKTLESLQIFTKTDRIRLSEISEMVVGEYDDFLIGRGVCRLSAAVWDTVRSERHAFTWPNWTTTKLIWPTAG